MNLADGNVKIGPDDSSSDEEDDDIQRKDSKLSTQVQTNLAPSSRGTQGEQFRSNSGDSAFNSNQKLVNVENVDENNLPEDKEIQSDNEEEEEE